MSKKQDNKENNKKQYIIMTVSLILLIILAIGTMFLLKNKTKEEENTLAYTDLIKEMSYGNVEKIEMKTGSTTVKVKIKNEEEEKTSIVPNVSSFIDLVQAKVAE